MNECLTNLRSLEDGVDDIPERQSPRLTRCHRPQDDRPILARRRRILDRETVRAGCRNEANRIWGRRQCERLWSRIRCRRCWADWSRRFDDGPVRNRNSSFDWIRSWVAGVIVVVKINDFNGFVIFAVVVVVAVRVDEVEKRGCWSLGFVSTSLKRFSKEIKESF